MNLTKPWNRIPDNIQWGLIWGAGFAGFFSLIALALWSVSVFLAGDPDPWKDVVDIGGIEKRGITIGEILAGYWIAGLVGGGIAGWLRPLASRSYSGAVVTGILVGIPVSAALSAVVFGLDWNSTVTVTWIASALVFGPVYATLIKSRYSGHLYQDEEGKWEIDPD